MIVGVPRGEEADPVPGTQGNVIAIRHAVRRAGRLEPLEEVALMGEHSCSGFGWWADCRPAPGCRSLDADAGDRALVRIDVVGRLELAIVDVIGIKEGAEAVRSHNGASALLGQQSCAAEVIGMRMRDDNGVHLIQGDARRVHAAPEGLPRLLAWEARIDQCETLGIFEGVRVDVAQSGEIDGQLQAQDSGHHLDDVRRGVHLLLFGRTRWALDRFGCRHEAKIIAPGNRWANA